MDRSRTDQNEGCALALAQIRAFARASGALWLPNHRTLIVSDLHLGKAERNARRGGGLWPPYENDATLSQLETEVTALGPKTLVMLGDSFDDSACVEALAEADRHRVSMLDHDRALVWITGNHDPAPHGLPGTSAPELRLGPLTLRHIADPDATGEISGHYHPKATIRTRGRQLKRKCFLMDSKRIILPAFGAYTGGLDVFHEAFAPLFGDDAEVILTGERALRAPLARLRALAA